mmetsp:Transcript_25771/g.74160  ORF Transcript_25771/g.74160 Transcript_25771/m.74160 type:complete len:361 (-) Transcript_25771:173-1255(-)
MRRKGVLAPLDQRANLFVFTAAERRPAIQQDVCQYAQGPQVALLVVLAREHLGGRIVKRPARNRHWLPALESRRQTEVDQLDPHRRLLEAEVLQLQIAMTNPMPVAVRQRGGHLPHEGGGIALRVPAHLRQVVEEVGAVDPFHDQAQPPRLLKHLQQPTDVRMFQPQLVLYFGGDLLELLRTQALGHQRLHRHLRPRCPGESEADAARHAGAKHKLAVQGVLLLEGTGLGVETAEAHARVHLQRLEHERILGSSAVAPAAHVVLGRRQRQRRLPAGAGAVRLLRHGRLLVHHLDRTPRVVAEYVVQDKHLRAMRRQVRAPVRPLRLPSRDRPLRTCCIHQNVLELDSGGYRSLGLADPMR